MKVALTGVKQLQKAFDSYAKTKTEELRDATKMAAINVDRDAKQNVRVDLGDLKNSIHTRHSSTEIESDVYTNKEHAPYEEFGTGRHVQIPAGLESVASQFRGGRGGNFQKLLENIGEWARKKGIPKEAVFPIARKIAREGRPGKAFLYPAWEKERPEYIKRVKRILRKI